MSLNELWNGDFWTTFFGNFWLNLLDIAIVWFVVYRLVKALSGTKEVQLIKGVALFLIIRLLFSKILGLMTVTWLMDQVMTYGVIAMIIIFQPELRKLLEIFGRKAVFHPTKSVSREQILLIYEKTVSYLSKRKIGALISIEREDSLQEYVETGIPLHAEITEELLINIFIPNTPLHDGAVLIQKNKIAAASAYLPLTERLTISKEYGTRHRAAIGLSEATDAVTIVVSEETGEISITKENQFLSKLTLEEFTEILKESLIEEEKSEKNSSSFQPTSFFKPFFEKKGGRKK